MGQVLALAGEQFLHQSDAKSLRNAAFNLPLYQRRVDCAPYIMRRRDLQNAHSAEFYVYLDFRHARAKSEHRIWNSLPAPAGRTGRRIKRPLARDAVSSRIHT